MRPIDKRTAFQAWIHTVVVQVPPKSACLPFVSQVTGHIPERFATGTCNAGEQSVEEGSC